MLKNFILKFRASVDAFVRKHIVDDEKNLWPNC